MIKAQDAIRVARSLIGTPYAELDCINLIKKVIRTAPGGVPGYTTAGTNTLWNSRNASAKYRDLICTQDGCARAGMLAFKRKGTDVHHVGLVTGDGTVIHSSSAAGKVVETPLDSSWHLLAVHRYIEASEEVQDTEQDTEGKKMEPYKMRVVASSLNVRNEPGVGGTRIGRISEGTVVTVQAEFDNGWKFVRYGDGALGYVDGSYLEEAKETQEAKPQEITIVDSAGNTFKPVGDFRVVVGSVD